MWNFHSIWWPSGHGWVQEHRDSLAATGWNLDWSQCASSAWPGKESPCKVMAASDLAALPASERSQGLLGCALRPSVLVKVLSRQINAPPARFVYHNEDRSVGREASLLPIQKFHKRGALRFLVVGKPQDVGWREGAVQVILQKPCLTLG